MPPRGAPPGGLHAGACGSGIWNSGFFRHSTFLIHHFHLRAGKLVQQGLGLLGLALPAELEEAVAGTGQDGHALLALADHAEQLAEGQAHHADAVEAAELEVDGVGLRHMIECLLPFLLLDFNLGRGPKRVGFGIAIAQRVHDDDDFLPG